MAEQIEMMNKCMSFIPSVMDKNEGHNLMTLLYEAGFLSDYFDALDATDENGFDGEHDSIRARIILRNSARKPPFREEVTFSHYFDFNDIDIDPQTGKITCLHLYRNDYTYDDEEDHNKTFDLPSIIGNFDMLERIQLCNCHLIPIELGRLSKLKRIAFYICRKNLLENIPEKLQLPSSTKRVDIRFSDSDSYSSLSTFMKILPDALEEFYFLDTTTREQTDEVLLILQKDDLVFSKSLTTLWISGCKLNEDDFELLLFEIRSNFPNLHTLNVTNNNIKSMLGIEARIKRILSSSSSSSSSSPQTKLANNNNLCKINLKGNPVFRAVIMKNSVIMKNTASIDPKEITAMLTFLKSFDSISNLALNPYIIFEKMYEPDIEYLLRKNKVNMQYTTTITTTTTTTTEEGNNSSSNENTTIINRLLWPLIFERAYKNSHEIYESYPGTEPEFKDHKKCATGLFELVRHGPFFAEDYQRRCHGDRNQKKTTTIITTTNYDNSNNNTTLKRKRSTNTLNEWLNGRRGDE